MSSYGIIDVCMDVGRIIDPGLLFVELLILGWILEWFILGGLIALGWILIELLLLDEFLWN